MFLHLTGEIKKWKSHFSPASKNRLASLSICDVFSIFYGATANLRHRLLASNHETWQVWEYYIFSAAFGGGFCEVSCGERTAKCDKYFSPLAAVFLWGLRPVVSILPAKFDEKNKKQNCRLRRPSFSYVKKYPKTPDFEQFPCTTPFAKFSGAWTQIIIYFLFNFI